MLLGATWRLDGVIGFWVCNLSKEIVAWITLLFVPLLSQLEFHLLQFVVVSQSSSSFSFYFAELLELLDLSSAMCRRKNLL